MAGDNQHFDESVAANGLIAVESVSSGALQVNILTGDGPAEAIAVCPVIKSRPAERGIVVKGHIAGTADHPFGIAAALYLVINGAALADWPVLTVIILAFDPEIANDGVGIKNKIQLIAVVVVL